MKKPNLIDFVKGKQSDFKKRVLNDTPDLPQHILNTEAECYMLGLTDAIIELNTEDMIDVLIECKNVLSTYRSEKSINAWYKAQQVLKDAGCTE